MSRLHPFPLVVVGLFLSISACSPRDEAPSTPDAGPPLIPGCEELGIMQAPAGGSGGDAGAGPAVQITDQHSLFDARIGPRLSFCRSCHVAGGVADTEKGRRYMLSTDRTRDYDNLRAAWTLLGGGVEESLLLLKPSGTAPGGHTGGAPWPKGGDAYEDTKALLSCWEHPAGCADALASRGLSPTVPDDLPLLGDLAATGGRNYAAVYCEGMPDCATLPPDPRELIAGENIESPKYAVYFNDPFEICETSALFDNQARGNAILVSQGKEPVYTAKLRPTTCGEWRAAVERGREYIVSNPITGSVLTVPSILSVAGLLGVPFTLDPNVASASLAQVAQQRYGWPASPYRNPAPFLGEDPNATDGGRLQLPLALTQVKDAEGKWTGRLGVTCFGCHVGQIGTGEVVGHSAVRDGHPELYGGSENGVFVGLNGSNTDPAIALYDIEQANGVLGPNAFNAVLSNPAYLSNRTRGSNAADQEIFSLLIGRDLDTLDWRSPDLAPEAQGKLTPTNPNLGGDQDMPSWWWTHNKTRYLWVGFGSAGSSRGNFFPASTNPFDGHWSKHREGDFQDMDAWLNAVEAPAFVGPPVDIALAEQGAILFHSKDLWADPANADIPRPLGGNGSCAGCHGAYSPRFIHQPGFLPDPRLAGTTGYTVPLEVVRTDPAQSTVFDAFGRDRTVIGHANSLWMSYPDAQEGYRMPEERGPSDPPFPPEMGGSIPDRKCGLATKGGYTAQPLHGVWASGPYFHNGSVPTVWDVLSPSTRPNIWRRQQVPQSEAVPNLGYRGFDTVLSRAYDYEKLGWKYETLACDPGPSAPYHLSCVKDHDVTTAPGPSAVDERAIYNTNAYSKGNQGHDYTKVLTDAERRAIIEYLKTL